MSGNDLEHVLIFFVMIRTEWFLIKYRLDKKNWQRYEILAGPSMMQFFYANVSFTVLTACYGLMVCATSIAVMGSVTVV